MVIARNPSALAPSADSKRASFRSWSLPTWPRPAYTSTTSHTLLTMICHRSRRTSSIGWAVPAAWARPGARQPWSRGGNRRIAFDGAGAEAEDRAQTDQRRPASCAAHNPEHAGNTHALPHAGRSILVARRRRKRADNRAISQPEIKRSRGSEEANISSHRRINDLPTTEPARKRFDWY